MSESTSRDRGAAIVVALFVALVVVLIGSAHLMTTHVERGVARNAVAAAEARLAAEAAALAVKLWFERPGSAPAFPAPSAVIRERVRIDPSDPGGGSPTTDEVQYKEGIDRDEDGLDDLFSWPYDGAPGDSFLGIEAAPDLRIADVSTLAALLQVAVGPIDLRPQHRLRIERVDIFAPPYRLSQGSWKPHGVATIKVEAVIEREFASELQIVARRQARMVLERISYGSSLDGPLHACADAQLPAEPAVGWGTVSVDGNATLADLPSWPASFPRGLPAADGGDRLWTNDPDWVNAFSVNLSPAAAIVDPWRRLVVAGEIDDAPSSAAQPWSGPPPPPPGAPGPWDCCDGSNLIQQQASAACPSFDYTRWKSLARSGLAGSRYFRWDPEDGFKEGANDPGRSVAELFAAAGGAPGFWFFDTADGHAPRDDDEDGQFDNLTPAIELGAGWSGAGFVILHAAELGLTGLTGARAETLRAPGEPRVEGGAAWIDLSYPAGVDDPFTPGQPGSWQREGPPIPASITFRGVLINRGRLRVGRGGTIYGALVGRELVLTEGGGAATRILWDASLHRSWPPAGWPMARFRIAELTHR